jgi:hypothetical protein
MIQYENTDLEYKQAIAIGENRIALFSNKGNLFTAISLVITN